MKIVVIILAVALLVSLIGNFMQSRKTKEIKAETKVLVEKMKELAGAVEDMPQVETPANNNE